MMAAIVMIVLVAVVAYQFMCPATVRETPDRIIIAAQTVEQSALILIAQDRGFFVDNGLNVTIKNYNIALDAIEGMKSGEADISESSEYPLAAEAFKKENISIISSIDKHQTVFLVGRKDAGIAYISDLKGKKIGYHSGGIIEFYLGRFLGSHNLSLQDVTIIDLKPSQFADALANGTVDALQISRKDMISVEKRLGSNDLVIWPSQSYQSAYEILACRGDWAAAHPESISRLLKSLGQAEEYLINHPAEAKAIVQKRLNYSDSYMTAVWQDNQYSLTLDQSLVIAMEDEGRWMISNNLTNVTAIPDFRKYIDTRGLKEVNPEAVNIIE